MSNLTRTLISNLALAMVLWGVPVSAQQQEPCSELDAGGDRPWARGVPVERQQAALELFLEGNRLIKQSAFVQAAERYTEALQLWEHPGIHYNLALALTPLRQPLEVYRHLEAATRHGPEPLDGQKYEFARTHKDLVRQQFALVEITCDKPGARVLMDGKLLFVAPGRHEDLVLSGQHTIVATLEGYLDTTKSPMLQAGESTKINLWLYTEDQLTLSSRLLPEWIPWAVLGAGAAVAGGGGLLQGQAHDSFRSFDKQVTECGGCMPDARAVSSLGLGNTRQTMAIGAYAVGGTALVTGMVLLYLNRAQTYRLTPEEYERTQMGESVERVGVTPVLGAGMGGALVTFRF
jgi:hypothetical protein